MKIREKSERNKLKIRERVQLFPTARQAIKYLVADGRFDYIETGSLISIKKNVKDILIPSEEYKIKMYPMDFEEFMWAKGDIVYTVLYGNMSVGYTWIKTKYLTRIMKNWKRYRESGEFQGNDESG